MSAEDTAVDHGEETNEFQLIEQFVCSMLPNDSQPSEEEVQIIGKSSVYDKQAMRSNLILNMANLIEMVTYLDNGEEEIEKDTIVSIDILSMEVMAEMVRYAFVLNGADAKVFCARVLSAFDYNESNPSASPDNTAVRYLEEALAYFIQEDEDDVRTLLRSLQVLNHDRPDLETIKWIGGQMFAREGGEPLDYNDFIEFVVVPYEQRASENDARRASTAFGDAIAATAAERPFIEQLEEQLAKGNEIGTEIQTRLETLSQDGPTISVVQNEPTMEQAIFGYVPGVATPKQQLSLGSPETIAQIQAGAEQQLRDFMSKIPDDELFIPIEDNVEAEEVRLRLVRAKILDTSSVDAMYPDLATCLRLNLPLQLAVDISPTTRSFEFEGNRRNVPVVELPGASEDGPLVNTTADDRLAFKPLATKDELDRNSGS